MKDGTYWAEKLAANQISFEELTAAIEQKVQENKELNALITFDRQQAIKEFYEKKRTDTLFAGLPIPLKMLGQEKAGWLANSASRVLKERRARHTDSFVAQLERCGLIPLGQTNAPEFGFKNVTDPEIYGPTRNPWALEHTPGGSSGGAAAAVASGIFPMAGASDGGGSIRIPASFCGLIGLKPSRGAMPVGPGNWRGWQGAAVHFALTVSMRDTEKLFYGMRDGIDKAAPYQAVREEWQHHQAANKKRLTIAFTTESPIGTPISEDAKEAVREAAAFLADQGHDVTEISYPLNGRPLIECYYLMNGGETAAMFDEIAEGLGRKVTRSDMELMTWGIYQYGRKIEAAEFIRGLHQWDGAAYQMEQLFDTYDLFLTPSTAFPAPRIDAELQSEAIFQQLGQAEELSKKELETLVADMFEKSLRLTPYTQLANLTGQPAISLPTKITDSGLPLGIQFMASKGREDLLLQAGYLFEENQLFQLPKAYRN